MTNIKIYCVLLFSFTPIALFFVLKLMLAITHHYLHATPISWYERQIEKYK